MEYLKEDQILLHEELCGKALRRDQITEATIRFRENIRLVHNIVKKYSEPFDPAVSKDDILQEGYTGLWKACLQFDDSKGFAFSTYAVPMIQGTILNMLRDNEVLKTPRVFKDIRSELGKHGFTLPLADQEMNILLEEGKFSRKQIIEYTQYSTISLDSYTTDDEKATLDEIIPDISLNGVYEQLSEDDIENLVDSILKYIKPIYRDLVEEWMYATLEGVHITNMELARKYGMSQPNVSRILNSAISIVKMHEDKIKSLFGY